MKKEEENNMKFQDYHEIIGRLRDVKNEKGKLNLTFAIETEVEIVDTAISFAELKKHVGSRVGIFHLKDGEYRIRTIK